MGKNKNGLKNDHKIIIFQKLKYIIQTYFPK